MGFNSGFKGLNIHFTDNKIEFNDKKSNVLFISRTGNDDRKVNI